VARHQALEAGVPLSTFDARVRREAWPLLHRTVRLLPGTEPTLRTHVSAALLEVGGGALVTARTGLFLHGVVDRAPPTIELVAEWTTSVRRLQGVRVIRSRTLIDDDRSVRDRLAVASVPRCFMDLGRTGGSVRLRTPLIDARQRRIADPTAVAQRAALHPGVPGSRLLAVIARDVARTGADSTLTDVVHRRLASVGLAPDDVPAPVMVEPQDRILHPDITFALRRVCIECDSLAHHGTQRAIDLDHRKDQAYRQAGWNCLRIGWYRLDHDWKGFVRDIRAALAGSRV
ncbi:MAG TPA: hypothetical protein VK923_13605, partial [Euzebyales bacterium]|nr:hypothetical protein [Euzebyales bacterium]